MEVLTQSTTHVFSTLRDLLYSQAIFDKLPQQLPVAPVNMGPPHINSIVLPNHLYFSIFFIFGGGLYLMFLTPFTMRQKQIAAAPLLFFLFVLPLIFTSDNAPLLQLAHMGACATVLMRSIDLYYVRPLRTGKEPTLDFDDWYAECWMPFRKVPLTKKQLQRRELELTQERIRRENEKARLLQKQKGKEVEKQHDGESDKKDKEDKKPSDEITPAKSTSTTTAAEKPMLGKPAPQFYTPPVDPNPKHWSAYLPRWIFYSVAVDVITFIASFFTPEQFRSTYVATLLFRMAVAAIVIFDISLANYTLMILWANVTGNLVHDTEWTLVRHKFPGFATSPADFWLQWHHLFKQVWVDLGAKPTFALLRKYVTPVLVKNKQQRQLAKALETVLPVMGVFLMSGLFHEFMMYGMWHSTPGPMTIFFLLHGVGTVVSKVLSKTVGQKVKVPTIALIAMTWVFNLTTAYWFMVPVIENKGYTIPMNQSVLIRTYNLLRAYGVF
ncbi:hypothetical protein BGW42_002352 [Actinomortierella wolfii]|nr:hypothetical protein BGW42_002352 [Actinomortierella wolfii]